MPHIGYCTGDNKVEIAIYLLGAYLLSAYVLNVECLGDSTHHGDFFAYRIDEHKMGFWEEYRKGDAREAAASANVENVCHRLERLHTCYGERVEHVVFHKEVNIFARNDVNLCVPIGIECWQGGELLLLAWCKIGEIFEYYVHLVTLTIGADNSY